MHVNPLNAVLNPICHLLALLGAHNILHVSRIRLTYVAVTGDRNVVRRGAERILKYKDCTVEIERMWTVNTEVIPVIIGATGTV